MPQLKEARDCTSVEGNLLRAVGEDITFAGGNPRKKLNF